MSDAIRDWLVGADAHDADKTLADALIAAATDITHEGGTAEATAAAIRITIRYFMVTASRVLVASESRP